MQSRNLRALAQRSNWKKIRPDCGSPDEQPKSQTTEPSLEWDAPGVPSKELVELLRRNVPPHSEGSHEERITRLERASAKHTALLSELIGELEPPPKGPYEKWIESKDAAKYQGMNIAWTLQDGVIASGKSVGEVLAALKDDPRKKAAVIDFVPGDGI